MDTYTNFVERFEALGNYSADDTARLGVVAGAVTAGDLEAAMVRGGFADESTPVRAEVTYNAHTERWVGRVRKGRRFLCGGASGETPAIALCRALYFAGVR